MLHVAESKMTEKNVLSHNVRFRRRKWIRWKLDDKYWREKTYSNVSFSKFEWDFFGHYSDDYRNMVSYV